MELHFPIETELSDNFIFYREGRWGGISKFIHYNPEEIEDLDVWQSIKIVLEYADMESETEPGLLERLNSLKIGEFLNKLKFKIKENQGGNQIYSSKIFYPIKINKIEGEEKKMVEMDKKDLKTDIIITAFSHVDNYYLYNRFDTIYQIADLLSGEIISYKEGH
jgi:hypothetical protein